MNADSAPGIHEGITLATPAGKSIWMNGPVIDQDQQPQAPDAVTLVLRGDLPDAPIAGRLVLFVAADGTLRARAPDGSGSFAVGDEFGSLLSAANGNVSIVAGQGSVAVADNGVDLNRGFSDLVLNSAGIALTVGGGGVVMLAGLPTVDPHAAGALWIAPLTRQLMVSAG